MKERLNKKNSEFKSKIADIEFAAISAMEDFLKEKDKEFELGSGVRAIYDSEVVYITDIFLKEGCSSLQYAYESEYQEYAGTAPASHFNTHHVEVFDEVVNTFNEIMEEEYAMQNPIETLKTALQWYGGYVVIPEEYRRKCKLSDGDRDHKTTIIKSIVSVCETPMNTPEQGVIVQVKVIDEDDTMWDAEEYMDTGALKDLVIICGKINSKAIR